MKKPTLRKKQTTKTPERITNDTVAEHRKKVLAGGRKFKYPIQYSRHKLVINTVIISILALIAACAFGWWQLYPQQNTGVLAYRVTSVIPLPVAEVDGEKVRYSDYLLKLRSAEHYIMQKEQSVSTGDTSEQRLYLKQQSMQDAIADRYALSLSRQHSVTITDDELNAFLKEKRQIEGSEISERTQYAVIRDYYDWSPEEYAQVMRTKLLRQKVVYEIDTKAKATMQQVQNAVGGAKPNESWRKLLETKGILPNVQYGTSGKVPKTNQDGGLAAAAAVLKKGETSDVIQVAADDGYYLAVVRLIDSDDSQVDYEFIRVRVTEFDTQLRALYKDGKVHVLIDVPLTEEA